MESAKQSSLKIGRGANIAKFLWPSVLATGVYPKG
jgi:hypothetical protein